MGDGLAGVRAVLFDVDGTLYSQAPVRAAMALELAASTVLRPAATFEAIRVLKSFRRTREQLRDAHDSRQTLDDRQYEACAAKLGVPADTVRRIVDEWIIRRPLKHLSRARRRDVTSCLDALAGSQVRIGALSDYPVDDKLRALGIDKYFSLRLCTTDRAINAFKPDPRGFLYACEQWGISPEEVLYVGDRPEVDGVGAAAAGTRWVIVGRVRGGGGGERGIAGISAFGDLARAFANAG